MSNLGLDRGRVCRLPPHGYALGTLVASAEALPATIPYTPSPSLFSHSSLGPGFLRPPHSRPSTRACFEFARPLAAFERILDADRALMARAGLCLDMQNSSQERRRNSAPEGWRNSAPPPSKPRGGPSALAGGEEQAGQARRP